jgi:ABC-type bacteriocin/lantibiotic exporter with double-glycine peptidase domain
MHTLYLFVDEPFGSLIMYLIPSFVLGFVVILTFKLKKLSALLLVLLSFIFLFIYQIQISLIIFMVLFFVGLLIFVDVEHMKTITRHKGKYRKSHL